jgi:hypothetical protein
LRTPFRSAPDACQFFLFADETVSNTIPCEAHMALKPMSRKTPGSKRPVEQDDHKSEKRINNPPLGLVDANSDAVEGKKTYAYDPHLDPTLVWAGKAERTHFEIPTALLRAHERIDPRSILKIVSGSAAQIATWILDTDYDGRSLFTRQVFFPMAGEKEGWSKLAKNLKAEIDETLWRSLSRHDAAAVCAEQAWPRGSENRGRPRF